MRRKPSFLPTFRTWFVFQWITCAVMLPGLVFLPPFARANPTGGAVVHGFAEIGEGLDGHLSILQHSDKAIINWEQFSIATGELTEFLQPGEGSAVLNRVVTGAPSTIAGALRANGNVFVINPNGVMVTPTGAIDVNGLVMSTLDVSDADFLAGGDMLFRGSSEAGITNMGRINAVGGDVFLIGKTIDNVGSITAPNGTIGLGASQEVLLTASPDEKGERVFVRPVGSGGAINNTGTIEGAAVELKAHGNMFALAINNSGSIRATGAVNQDGRVFLRAPGGEINNSGEIAASMPNGDGGMVLVEAALANIGGTVDASAIDGGVGGDVRVLGEQINVTGAVLADGDTGGTIQIGGLEGETQAESILIAGGSRVSASGISGSGGLVNIVGSQAGTVGVDGTLAATGAGGAGGQVMVSGGDVTLGAASVVDASGDEGGTVSATGENTVSANGQIRVIGSTGVGGDVTISGVNETTVGASAVIDASGETDGGLVDISSGDDGVTTVDGQVSAIGNTGDGGMINVAGGKEVNVGVTAVLNASGDQNGGVITVESADGLTNFAGQAIANGANGVGGNVNILGDQVNVLGTALVEANGATRGGNIQVGGSFQGGDASVQNATNTNVASGAVLSANGTGEGSIGGNVIVWADEAAVFEGNITAEAVEHGGFVEVSGKSALTFAGDVSTLAVSGFNGTLLLDPSDFLIENGASGAATANSIRAVDLAAQLNAGNVIITTTAGGTGAFGDIPDGNILVDSNANVLWASSNSLTLAAYQDVDIRASIQNAGDGDVNIIAGWDPTTGPLTGAVDGSASGVADPAAQVDAMFGNSTAYGNNDGTVYIGERLVNPGRSNDINGAFVGSRFGETNILAYGAEIVSGAAWREGAQVGFHDPGVRAVTSGDQQRFENSLTDASLTDVDYGATPWGTGVLERGNGATGDITIELKDSLRMQKIAASGDGRSFVQIGHGGPNESGGSGGDFSGDITIRTGMFGAGTGNIDALIPEGGLTSTEDYIQIGHGGYNQDGNHSGAISIDTSAGTVGDISIAAGADFRQSAQIGHGGNRAGGVMDGSIEINAGGKFTALAGGVSNPRTGVWGTSPYVRQSEESFVQVGHGGYDSDGVKTGDITLRTGLRAGAVAGDGDVLFRSGDARNNYAQLGHGGRSSGGDVTGAIVLDASNGEIVFDARGTGVESDSQDTGNSARNDRDDAYAQLGHGGVNARGVRDGTITVDADAGISFFAGDQVNTDIDDRVYAMLGHGGENADSPDNGGNANQMNNGAINVTANGDVLFDAGSGRRAFAQLGHGGALTQGRSTGDISLITTGGSVKLLGGSGGDTQNASDSYAQIGHGGSDADGNHEGDITVTATIDTNGDGVALISGDQLYAYTQIGHGGNAARSGVGAAGYGLTGDIAVTAEGDISLIAGTQKEFFSNSDSRIYSQIGHGGADADYRSDGGVDRTDGIGHNGDIAVISTNGSIKLLAGDADRATDASLGENNGQDDYAMIGHGGTGANGNHFGDITVRAGIEADGTVNAADADVLLAAGGGSQDEWSETRRFAQIGHGGARSQGNYGLADDVITVMAGHDIRLEGGNGERNYAMIGNGGDESRGDHQATIQVFAENDIFIQGSDAANDGSDAVKGSYTFTSVDPSQVVRNIDRAANAGVGTDTFQGTFNKVVAGSARFIIRDDSGNILGTFSDDGAGNLLIDAAFSADMDGDTVAENFAANQQVGTVEYSGDVGATFTTDVNPGADDGYGNIVFEFEHTDNDRTYAQIGNGGLDADNTNDGTGPGNSGNISVAARTGDITISGGTGRDSYAQVGNGGYDNFGDHSGTITMRAGGDILAESGNPGGNRAYTQIGHGGFDADGNHSGDIKISSGSGSLATLLGTGQFDDVGDFDGDTVADTFTFVDNSTTGITFDASNATDSDTWIQVGHGGRASAGNADGAIAVLASRGISLESGNGNNGYSQIGHGGVESSGDKSGGISVIADGDNNGSGALSLTSKNASNNYSIIGHGGRPSNDSGTRAGDIYVQATDISLNPGSAGNRTAAIGHSSTTANEGLTGPTNYQIIATGNGIADGAGSDLVIGGDFQDYLQAALTVGGNVTLAAGRDLLVNTAFDYSSAGDLTFMAVRDVDVNRLIQNNMAAGGGDVNLLAGWSGADTGFTGTLLFNECPPTRTFDFAAVKALFGTDDTTYGSGGVGNEGSVVFSYADAQASGALTVGSVSGQSNAAGYGLVLEGGGNSQRSQLGYDGAGTGSIMVNTGDGGVQMTAGTGTRSFAKIGHGTTRSVQVAGSGMISVETTGSVAMQGGSNQDAYAQVGHGGILNNVNQGLAGDTIDVIAGTGVTMTAGSGDNTYTLIGNGGLASNTALQQADITVTTAAGDITLNGSTNNADAADDSFAQIGNTGVGGSARSEGDITVRADAGSVILNGGGGSVTQTPNYVQIGHGGAQSFGAAGAAADTITVSAQTVAVNGGNTGEKGYAQIGSGGFDASGALAGTIDVTATSSLTLQGGSALGAYAQIGHGGRDMDDAKSGAITVNVGNAGAGTLSLIGGGDEAYAQIGHGGTGNTGAVGAGSTININQGATAGSALNFSGGTGTGSYAQVGHGGYLSSFAVTDQAINIDATAVNTNGSDGDGGGVTGGTGQAAYVQIGHGGYNETRDAAGTGLRSGFSEQTRSGDIDIDVSGNFDFIGGGGTGAYVQIGHGGRRNNAVNGEGHSGSINIDARTFDLYGGAGAETYAMAGHGGYQTTGSHSGDVTVVSNELLRVRADVGGNDDADRAFAQIGHGGYDADFNTADLVAVPDIALLPYYVDNRAANLSGDITVTANSNNVIVRAVQSNTAQEAYAQIGHGGYDTTGNFGVAGDVITVSAVGGSVEVLGVQNGAAVDLLARSNYAQIGNGGVVNNEAGDSGQTVVDPNLNVAATGSHTGDIIVTARNRFRLDGGADNESYAQLGHGGVNNGSGGGHTGDITVNVTSNASNGDVFIEGGAGGGFAAHAQIGHGGRNSDGDHSGSITVNAARDVNLAGSGSSDSFVMIGHGGRESEGNHGSASDNISVTAGRDVLLTSGGTASFAMIGLGGFNSGGDHQLNDLTVTAAEDVLATGSGTDEFKMIGLGGRNSSGNFTVNDIDVTATTGQITFAGNGSRGFAMIGAGGHASAGDHTVNDITATANGDVTLSADLGAGFSMIGVGGFNVDGVLAANDISVTSNTGVVTLTSGVTVSASDAFTQIGVGGRNSDGAKSANSINVTANGADAGGNGISLTSGVNVRDYAQIGVGGHQAHGPSFAGDINVTSNAGGISVVASDIQNQSYAHIGHGGRFDRNVVSYEVGAMTGEIVVAALGANSDVVIDGGGGTSYAQIGHGGYQAGIDGDGADHSGMINLDAGRDLIIRGGVALDPANGNGFAMLGNGGGDSDGDFSGLLQVDVGRDISLLGGGTQADPGRTGQFVQIGHGGLSHVGSLDGDIQINQNGGAGAGAITLTGGDSNTSYAQIGLGGYNHSGAVGGNTSANITLTTAGAVNVLGGTDNDAYAQIGHIGGDGDGDVSNANIVVNAGTGVAVTGGSIQESYAQIGHGGDTADGGGTGFSGNVTVTTTTGDVALSSNPTANASGNRTSAQIGHGGINNSDTNGGFTGDIIVTATAGSVRLLSGAEGSNVTTQIGHGGVAASTVDGFSGSINVTAGTDIILDAGGAGGGSSKPAQIGHGGVNTDGDFSGDITLLAGNDVTINGGSSGGAQGQVGHGGANSDGTKDGDISVTATAGDVTMAAGGASIGFSQIGHGGNNSTGNIGATAGDVSVVAGGDVNLAGNQNGTGSANTQIGHGGLGSGNIGDTAAGTIIVNSIGGDILLTGSNGGAGESYVQIGHAGQASDYAVTDQLIDVDAAAGALTILGSGAQNHTMIGHGGERSTGDVSGQIDVNVGGDITLTGGANTDAAAQIGHGGNGASGATSGDIEMGTTSGNIAITSGNSNGGYAQIGNGGLNNTGGSHVGEICVHAENGTITLEGDTGGGTDTYVQIGHGGTNATATVLDGDVTVVGNGTVLVDGGDTTGEYAQIGHGGLNTVAAMSGDISVVSVTGAVDLDGGTTTDTYAMIGHGDGEGNTSSGTREGGVHIFADGLLSATNGAGVENVNIYHQTNGGLSETDYLGGDGFQLVGNGGTSFADSAVDDVSTMVNENGGVVQISFSNDTDVNIGPGSSQSINSGSDYYILTGGSIVLESSFQNEGTGDVLLIAGWDGTGVTFGDGSVTFPGLDFCDPQISERSATFDFNNCEAYGNDADGNGAGTVTLGNASQTSSMLIGSRGGTTTILGAGLTLNASTNTANAATQVGFFGTAGGTIDGAITIGLHEEGLTMNSGSQSGTYTQIGHGGFGSTNSVAINAPITISFCETGDVNLNAGSSNNAYSQIGHGGRLVNQNREGDISITGFGDLNVLSGTADSTFGQIGHGGRSSGGSATNADIVLTGSGDITLTAGNGPNSYVMVGHGGEGIASGSVQNGSITLSTSGGTIDLNGGTGISSYVHVGHGGQTANGNKGLATDTILVQADGDITFDAGEQNNGWVQVGNGGLSTTGTHQAGSLSVISDNGDINLLASTSTLDDGYVQIGHGTSQTSATGIGDIRVEALNGTVFLNAEAGPSNTGGVNTPNFAQIGNGGHQNQGAQSGQIVVLANAISLDGGTSTESYAQIGHGGFEDDANADGALDGDIFINFDPVTSLVSGGGGDISLNAGTATYSYAQIGHGGRDRIAATTGDIRIGQAANLSLIGGSSTGAYAQIGHGGGRLATRPGGSALDADIQIDVLGDVTLTGGGTESYAQIGHGGHDTDSFETTGDILINTAAGMGTGDFSLDAGSGSNAYAQIGHGGTNTVDADSNKSGTITIDKANNVLLGTKTTGEGTDSYVQIGNGGDESGGTASGNITVNATNALTLSGGSGSDTYAQVGNGGHDVTDAVGLDGESVNVNAAVITMTGGSAERAYVQIGNGGADVDNIIFGDVNVNQTSGGTGALTMNGGTGADTYVLIGIGGSAADGTKDGDTRVTAASADVIAGTSSGAYAQIGAGSGIYGNTSDFGSGTLTTSTFVTTTVGGVNVSAANAGSQAYAQIGGGGLLADGALTGSDLISTVVNSAGAVQLTGGTGSNNYALIGLGGSGINGNKTNAGVMVTGSSVSLNGGTGPSTYAQIGSGGGLTGGNNPSEGSIDGDVSVVATSGSVSLTSGGALNAYAMIGNGGTGTTRAATGDVSVTAATDVILDSADATGDRAYTQIGHGGYAVSANHSGAVSVEAGTSGAGGVMLTAGAASNGRYSQIGNGGLDVTGDLAGDISIIAKGDVTLNSGAAGSTDAYVQIGHGGADTSGVLSGSTMVDTTGIVTLNAGDGTNSYAQIGAGGVNADGTRDMGITAVTGSAVALNASDVAANYAQIGAGGAGSVGDSLGDIAVRALSADMTLNGGDAAGAYAQIGHGGVQAIGSKAGNIGVVVGVGGNLMLTGGAGDDAYTQVGHGGNFAGGPLMGATGNFINVDTDGSVTLNGGDGLRSSAVIGSGGFDANAPEFNSQINVDARTDVILNGGAGDFAQAQIGAGGTSANGVKNGNILVNADNDLTIARGTGANSGAKIGHGDHLYSEVDGAGSAAGAMVGDIQVTAGMNITSTGGLIGGGDPNLQFAAAGGTGNVFIAASRIDPTDSLTGGSIITDAATVFSTPDQASGELRLYAPSRAQMQIAVGTTLNDASYIGTQVDPSPRREDELIVLLNDPVNGPTLLNEHENLDPQSDDNLTNNTVLPDQNFDTYASASTLGNYSLYLNVAEGELTAPTPGAGTAGPGAAGPGAGAGAGPGAGPGAAGPGAGTTAGTAAGAAGPGTVVPPVVTTPPVVAPPGTIIIGFDSLGNPIIVTGVSVDDQGLFIVRGGVTGFTPGTLNGNFVPVGGFLSRILDDFFNDDEPQQHIEGESGESIPVGGGSYISNPDAPGWSSFNQFSSDGVIPNANGASGVDDEELRRQLEELEKQLEALEVE